MKYFALVVIGVLAGCGDDRAEDPFLGAWEGEWFAEGKGKAFGTVSRGGGGGYRLEVRDADGVVTWLDGEVGEDGLEFTTGEDSPDRYLSKWRAFVPGGGGELVGQSYPEREFGGFTMRRAE